MTDHNGQPGSFGPPQQPQQPQQQAWQAQGQGGQQAQQAQAQQQPATPQPSYAQPQQLPSDAARAQVAAAWVRNAPGQAAVPTLPPRETARPQGESKKEKRERERAARKAAYERKKAAKEQRKKGGTATAPAPTAAATSSASAASAPSGTASPATTAPPARPSRDFDVPKPGGRIAPGGRRTHVALRATLLITTCVFALGSCGVMGLMVGKSSGPSTAGLDAADAARYRLTDFPTQQAASFAEQYALLCMTYSPERASTRRENLARYASAGVDPECGWSGEGKSTALSATWDGTAEKLPEYGDNGRYIGVQVRTTDGALTTLTVPVYVKDLKTGEGMRVAGDVGQMPMPARADVPEVDQDNDVVDDALSQQLQEKVLPGYFTAWGASDATAMSRFTTTDASQAATSGLAGRLSEPTVNDVVALVPASVKDTDPYAYKEGQSVQVRVIVDWGDPKGETVRRSYRMTVVNTAQGWFIKDIRGGVLDPDGGRADSDDTDTAPGTGTGAPSSAPTDPADPNASGPASPSASASTTTQSSKGRKPGKS